MLCALYFYQVTQREGWGFTTWKLESTKTMATAITCGKVQLKHMFIFTHDETHLPYFLV